MNAKPDPVFHTLTSDDWRRAIASARKMENPTGDAIRAKIAEVKRSGRPIASGLRGQIADGMSYFAVTEPNGVILVAARSARQAQALYFDAVKDTIWGDPGNPEPYLITQIHVRPATPDDLRDFAALRVVPAQVPLRPTVLNERIDPPQPLAGRFPIQSASRIGFTT